MEESTNPEELSTEESLRSPAEEPIIIDDSNSLTIRMRTNFDPSGGRIRTRSYNRLKKVEIRHQGTVDTWTFGPTGDTGLKIWLDLQSPAGPHLTLTVVSAAGGTLEANPGANGTLNETTAPEYFWVPDNGATEFQIKKVEAIGTTDEYDRPSGSSGRIFLHLNPRS